MPGNSAETRLRIIDAAYTRFCQRGFIRTCADAIADAAGLAKRTLYQHSRSKEKVEARLAEKFAA